MNVYDFDNTIYDGESPFELFFFYLRRHLFLIRYMPKVIVYLGKYKLQKVSVDSLIRDHLGFTEDLIRGLEGYEDDFADFWDKRMHKIKPFYLAQQKEDDVIVSASPEVLLSPLFERINIKNYIGTELDFEAGKITFPCFRENKAVAFKKRYPGAVIENFYTDSMNDQA
ncbi:MAG TPA: haloacid dehalogenase-like hydrolase, partial [Clostridia bacterium]|nr:haloacid dehalogenase-like hydrolase [Clostridia bacterium]